MVVKINFMVFWVVVLCGVVVEYRLFGPCCFHLKGSLHFTTLEMEAAWSSEMLVPCITVSQPRRPQPETLLVLIQREWCWKQSSGFENNMLMSTLH